LSPSISSAIILPIRLHTNLPELAIEYVRLSPSISSAKIMAEDIDGDNLTYSIASSGKLVCNLIGRIMAEDIDGDNLTYSITKPLFFLSDYIPTYQNLL
jgi:hypothetical protein